MVVILCTLIALVVTPLLWWYLTLRKFKSLDKIPGPNPLPIVGNALALGNNPQEFLQSLVKFNAEYGNIFKAYIGNELHVVITDPVLLESLLSSNEYIEKSSVYDLLQQWLGDGLITSKGNKWKSRRKMITPSFHFKILEEFVQIFNSGADTLVKKFQKEVGKKSVDIYPLVNLCTLDMICETAMGLKVSEQTKENIGYVTAVKDFMDLLLTRMFSFWMKSNTLFKFSPKYKLWQNSIKVLHEFTNDVIEARRREFSKRKLSLNFNEEGIKRRVALLDMLLQSSDSNKLTTEDIREEIDTFMFAGHDTTTSGIVFALLALAYHPEIQEKLYEEIISAIGKDKETVITIQEVQDLKYLDMILKESQRLYTTVPIIERKLQKEYKLGGYAFPEGTIITVFLYGLHNSSENFPDPEKFDPDRFSLEERSQRHNFAYTPFSAGPRNCIGQKFAILEMKIAVTKIIREFRLLPVPGFKPELGMSAILRSYNGSLLRVQNR